MEESQKREESRGLIGHRDTDTSSAESDPSPKSEPPCNARNIGKTTAAYIAFFGGGIGNAIIGATLLHLQQLTHTSMEKVSSLFTWRALGSLSGNLVLAAIFDHTRPEALLIFATFMVGFMNLCVPWCSHFLYLALVMAVQGFSHGMLGGGCNGYVVKVWQLRSPPFMQFLQFIISFGSAITPFMVDVFVTTDLTSEVHQTPNSTVDSTDNGSLYDVVIEEYFDVFYDIVYSYTIAGIVMMVACVAFIMVFIVEIRASMNVKNKWLSQRKNSLDEIRTTTNTRATIDEETGTIFHENRNHILFTISVIAFCVVYGGMECTYGGFILTFAVEYLGVSFETATIVSTTFWGALAGGRALAVALVKFFKPHIMIVFSLVISTTAILVLTFTCHLHIIICMVCSALIGLSFAPLFGNVISYSQQVIPLTGRETSLFVAGLYIGYVGAPAMVGYLFTKYTPMLLLYMMSVSAITCCGLFVGVLFFAHSYVKNKKDNADAIQKGPFSNYESID